MTDSLDLLRRRLRGFAAARDWEQFHTPKNLAMAVAGEAGELVAEVQWLTDDDIRGALAEGGDGLRARLSREMADVLIYLIRLSDVTGVDLVAAANTKIDLNHARYPVKLARGNAIRADALRDESR